MFKQLGNMAGILRQAQEMGGKLQELQEHLKGQRVVGNAGGGMVEVEMTGTGEVIRVKLDPGLIERHEIEMLESLLPAAINHAQTKARQCHAEAMKELTGGLNLPGLDEALAKFT